MNHLKNFKKIKNKPTIIKTPNSEIIKYWLFFVIFWGLTYLSLRILINILNNWSSPYYVSANYLRYGRLGEITAFALSVILIFYTIITTLYYVILLLYKKLKDMPYLVFNRMHTLVFISFIIHCIIFLIIFYRP